MECEEWVEEAARVWEWEEEAHWVAKEVKKAKINAQWAALAKAWAEVLDGVPAKTILKEEL